MVQAADVVEIEQLLYRVHHLIDRREWNKLNTVFTSDAEYDLSYRNLPVVQGLDAIVDLNSRSFERDFADLVSHNTVNVLVTEGADGEVQAESKVICVLTEGRAIASEHHDIVVKTENGWRIKRRASTSRDPAAAARTRREAGTEGGTGSKGRAWADRYFEIIHARQYLQIGELFAPGCTYLNAYANRVLHDPEEIAEFYDRHLAALEPVTRIISFIEQGNTVAFEFEAQIRGRNGYQLGAADHVTLGPDGKATKFVAYPFSHGPDFDWA